MPTVLITGDREWSAAHVIARAFDQMSIRGPAYTIVHGACHTPVNADKLAAREAHKRGCVVRGYPAKWGVYGRGAGPVRNAYMLQLHPEIEIVLAFHDDLFGRSRGTRDMVERALAKGLYCWQFLSFGGVLAIPPSGPTESYNEALQNLRNLAANTPRG